MTTQITITRGEGQSHFHFVDDKILLSIYKSLKKQYKDKKIWQNSVDNYKKISLNRTYNFMLDYDIKYLEEMINQKVLKGGNQTR